MIYQRRSIYYTCIYIDLHIYTYIYNTYPYFPHMPATSVDAKDDQLVQHLFSVILKAKWIYLLSIYW